MSVSRRQMAAAIPALLAATGRSSAAERLPAMAINRDELPTRQSKKAFQKRFFDGLTHEDIPVEVHETELPPGEMPHPAHRHAHEELTVVEQGVLEVYLEGQEPKRVSAGAVVYAASNQMHGWKSVGDVSARYVVIAIGHRS